MTVFNYFARKEDLFLDRHADQLWDIENVVVERATGESVANALRRYEHHLLETRHELSGAFEGIAGCWQIISASPALLSRLHEQALELLAALRRTVDGQDVERVRRDQAALIDTAFELVERGIGDFGTRCRPASGK